jgi:hypothetical protein
MPCLTLFLFYMPFLSSFGGAASVGFGLSRTPAEGGGGPYTGTLYYYEGADESDTTSTWATLAKWYKNSEHNQAASNLPTVANATVLLNNTSADLETWTAPASINITGKSLTLSAHALENGCASAREFSTTVTADSSSNLILSGHMLVTGVNHPLSTFVIETSTYYYFDSNIAVDSYIYQNQYSDVVAAVALEFDVELAGTFYTITTDSTGKVISKVEFSVEPPVGDDVTREVYSENIWGRLVRFTKYLGYVTRFAVEDCADVAGNEGNIDADGVGFKLLTSNLTVTSKDPVYLVATRDEGGSLTYLEDPAPYFGNFTYVDTPVGGVDVYKQVTTDAYGYVTAVITCE